MKKLAILMMLFFSINLFGQVRIFDDIPKDILNQLDKMGVDELSLLNSDESAYFNVVFKENLMGFDFTGKKVGFIYSGARSNKKEYFDLEKSRFKLNLTPNRGTLYIFDTTQKEESGGYDAAIVYWSKILVSAKDVVKRLKKNTKNVF